MIAGNVIAYGATAGEIYLRGIVGERFCVRNSGVTAVVEGVGDHGCEYMTGGRVVVLGRTGINFGAGMSGGIAYVYDNTNDFDRRVNYEMVRMSNSSTPSDREFLRSTDRTAHLEHTDSAVAKRMLASWSVEVSRFRKVMPTDYKRVLTVMKESEAAGLSDDETVDRIMEAAKELRKDTIMGETTGFMKWDARDAPVPARSGPTQGLERGLRGLPRGHAQGRRPGAAWTAASRSATTAARSAT